jgi:hypothetical protein
MFHTEETRRMPTSKLNTAKLRTTCIVLDEKTDGAITALREAMGHVTQSVAIRLSVLREYQRMIESGETGRR